MKPLFKKIAMPLAFIATIILGFSACLKQENVELLANPLEILNDPLLTHFKLDSVVMIRSFSGFKDVNVYYSNSYATFSAETQKRISGVSILNGNAVPLTVSPNQKNIYFREQTVGTVLNLSFAFSVNSNAERSRETIFQIKVQ